MQASTRPVPGSCCWRAALDNIADINILPFDPHAFFDDVGQELACGADEGPPLLVFLESRALATKTTAAFGFPSPKTMLFLPLCSLHRVQSPRSFRMSSSDPGLQAVTTPAEAGRDAGGSAAGAGAGAGREAGAASGRLETASGFGGATPIARTPRARWYSRCARTPAMISRNCLRISSMQVPGCRNAVRLVTAAPLTNKSRKFFAPQSSPRTPRKPKYRL